MFRGMPFAAVVVAIAISTGLTACGSAGSSERAGGAALLITSLRGVGGSPGAGRSAGAYQSLCNPIPALPRWYGIYRACVSANGTFTQLTNTSDSGVLLLQVPLGAPRLYMSVDLTASLA